MTTDVLHDSLCWHWTCDYRKKGWQQNVDFLILLPHTGAAAGTFPCSRLAVAVWLCGISCQFATPVGRLSVQNNAPVVAVQSIYDVLLIKASYSLSRVDGQQSQIIICSLQLIICCKFWHAVNKKIHTCMTWEGRESFFRSTISRTWFNPAERLSVVAPRCQTMADRTDVPS